MGQERRQAKLASLESRAQLPGTWQSTLLSTCPDKPGFFCFAICCPWCASYSNRKKVLHGDMSRYLCCQGHCPCSGKMKEKDCPEFCLCMETWYCFAISVTSTRWTLQDQLGIRNTKCDNCIIGTMVFLQYLSCICSLVACLTDNEAIDDAAECTDCIADIAYCSVCGCMQTQARIEMCNNERFINSAPGGAQLHMAPPPAQHMKYSADAPPAGYAGGPSAGYPGGPPAQYMQHPGAGAGAPPPGYPQARDAAPPGYPPAAPAYPGYPPQGNYGAPPPGYPRA